MKKSFLTFLLMLFCLAGFAQQTVTGVILEEYRVQRQAIP